MLKREDIDTFNQYLLLLLHL